MGIHQQVVDVHEQLATRALNQSVQEFGLRPPVTALIDVTADILDRQRPANGLLYTVNIACEDRESILVTGEGQEVSSMDSGIAPLRPTKAQVIRDQHRIETRHQLCQPVYRLRREARSRAQAQRSAVKAECVVFICLFENRE